MFYRLVAGLLTAAICIVLAGCKPGPAKPGGDTKESAANSHNHESDQDHDHLALGPHKGHVIVLGDEEYHAELTHEEATNTVAVYLLDASATEPLTEGPSEVTLQVFKDGEFVNHVLNRTDTTGMYAVTDEALCDFLLHAAEVKGRIRAEIGGKPYVGVVEHAPHDHSGHEAHDHGSEHEHNSQGDGMEEPAHDHGEAGSVHECATGDRNRHVAHDVMRLS